MLHSPFIIHAQCQTVEPTLPTAKFDVIVTCGQDSISASSALSTSTSGVTVILSDGQHNKEDVEVAMTNKTDSKLNLHKLSML